MPQQPPGAFGGPIMAPSHLAAYHHNAKAVLNEIQRPIPLPPADPQYVETLRARDTRAMGLMGTLLTQVGKWLSSARCGQCGVPISVDCICYSCISTKAINLMGSALTQIKDQEHTVPTPKEIATQALEQVKILAELREKQVGEAFKAATMSPQGIPDNGNEPSRIIRL